MSYIYWNKYVFLIDDQLVFAAADDVLISATYAKTMAEGYGLTWYPGADHVQGFTNLLWTLWISLFSSLPFFQREYVGLYLLCSNLIILCGILHAYQNCLETIVEKASIRKLGQVLILFAFPLFYWLAAGFEFGLVTLIALHYFRLARMPATISHGALRGILFGVAIWVRMDSILVLLPLEVYCFWRERSIASSGLSLALGGISACGLLAFQWNYYGDPLPNTYHLKSTGWPWGRDKVYFALLGVHSIVPALFLLCTPLLVKKHWPTSNALWLASPYLLTVIYTLYVGGDALGLRFGQNRFTVTAYPFLLLSIAIVIGDFCSKECVSKALLYVLVVLTLVPLLISTDSARKHSLLALTPRHPATMRTALGHWTRAGLVFGEVSPPGSRLAVTGAGASIYFSRRGGVDLLGKSDPVIARMQAIESSGPGHNKYDRSLSFRLHKPEASLVGVPTGPDLPKYRKVYVRGVRFYVRSDVRLNP